MAQRVNAFSVAPDGLAALVAVEKYLHACGLAPKLITLVKTRVSQINGCAYCLHMHTEDARKLGESEIRLYLLDAWRESNLYSPRERAALAWAESLTAIATTRGKSLPGIGDTLSQLLSFGLSAAKSRRISAWIGSVS
jgi:AhpD family alkylhydroperoxidase